MVRKSIKNWLKKTSPVALSKNHYYDRLTWKIIRKYCSARSNCIDVGCHKGEVLDLFIKQSPGGQHFAFEPIPYLFDNLINRYKKFPFCKIYNYALSDQNGKVSFNHVITNPAYSGIKKRSYDKANEKDEQIDVIAKKLDDVLPENIKIDLIKIDVEGGEFNVLKGSVKTIEKSRPLIIFEFGIGGSDIYGITAEVLYKFMDERNYKISLLDDFLSNKSCLALKEFEQQFRMKKNYYFIAFHLEKT